MSCHTVRASKLERDDPSYSSRGLHLVGRSDGNFEGNRRNVRS